MITQNALYISMMDRLNNGARENTPHLYHPIAGLQKIIQRKDNIIMTHRLRILNTTRALSRRTRTIATYKQFVMAIGKYDIKRLRALVATALRRKSGIKGVVELVERAVQGLYKARGYDKEDHLRSHLLLLLGGARVARIAQRAFGGPSTTTLRRNTISEPLKASPSSPTIDEVSHNIKANFPNSGPLVYPIETVRKCGAVLMFDEVKVEERVRWEPSTNRFLGVCREHSKPFSLEFCSIKDLEQLEEGLERNEVHRASEVRNFGIPICFYFRYIHSCFHRPQSLQLEFFLQTLVYMLHVLSLFRVLAREKQR
jgi:hypothetical protein